MIISSSRLNILNIMQMIKLGEDMVSARKCVVVQEMENIR